MRRVLLFIVILLIIAGSATWFLYLRPKKIAQGEIPATGFKSYFPLGTNTAPDSQIGDFTPPTTTPQTQNPSAGRFTRIINTPVAGFTVFSRTVTIPVTQTDPAAKPSTRTVVEHVLRYVSRGNGYVYEVVEREGKTELPLQISNIFIPNIYEASFMDNNKTALLRFLRDDNETIATYSVPIPDQNTDNTRTQNEGTYLPNNIVSYAVSPNQTLIGKLTIEQNSGVIGISSSLNTLKKELFRSPVREWILAWPNQGALYLQTKAAATAQGFLYYINTNTKSFRKVVGNVSGLTTNISPSGTYVLYSQSINNGFTTRLLNTKTNITTTLNLSILPEKCTWLISEDLICAGNTTVEEGVYPDSWYAGITQFRDQLYRIYTKVGTYDVIYENTDMSYDMTNLKVQEDQNTLYFIDKTTGFLWKTKL